MLSRVFSLLAIMIAAFAIYDGFRQKSAFILGQEKQTNYSPRYGTNLSGGYNSSGVWIYHSTTRTSYGEFQGGGPGGGK